MHVFLKMTLLTANQPQVNFETLEASLNSCHYLRHHALFRPGFLDIPNSAVTTLVSKLPHQPLDFF